MKTNFHEKIILEAQRRKVENLARLDQIKRKFSADFQTAMPTNSELFKSYRTLVKNKKIKSDKQLELCLRKRGVRTLSGVAVIAVLTKPYPCPGKCTYCPSEKNMPQSYLSNEPAVMRAILCQFNPFRQVKLRLKALKNNGHPTDKIELIIMGGTWSSLPRGYQNWFIKRCFDGLNASASRTLAQAQKKNEKAQHRCVGLTLETRPDYIDLKEIKRMRNFGATRLELGVQNLDNSILLKNQRGHKVAEVTQATKQLKNAGFKIMYHIMPNLPGATPARDLKMFEKLFTDARFKPDMLKIYPCVVTRGAKIHGWWKRGDYKPYSNKKLIKLLVKIKSLMPHYVRITRLIRDIPAESIEAGNKVSNLRQLIQKEMDQQGLNCQCIRCREARGQKVNLKNAKLFIEKYEASGGIEYFLSFESRERKILYAFLRLRLPGETQLKELANAALIREVHTYGQLVPLKKSVKQSIQHAGFGKRLISTAEKIALKENFQKIAVISGIGVRQYYQKLGYQLTGTYLIKSL